jgi:hypothetical protein
MRVMYLSIVQQCPHLISMYNEPASMSRDSVLITSLILNRLFNFACVQT